MQQPTSYSEHLNNGVSMGVDQSFQFALILQFKEPFSADQVIRSYSLRAA